MVDNAAFTAAEDEDSEISSNNTKQNSSGAQIDIVSNGVGENIKNDAVSSKEDKEKSEACVGVYRRFLTDWRGLCLLMFLYMLQGLPLGLKGAIPLIMQESNVTYSQQAEFSFAGWPFSLKLLWAPLVDALYFKRLGRRKSWLVPVQYLIAITMFFLSFKVDQLIENMQISTLTLYFFFLNFLTATQDITVDGWALTMLRRENVGLASTCNSIGRTLGAFIGYTVFLNLASPNFANKYFRSEPKPEGLVTLASFMFGWSCIYFACTTLILIFKREINAVREEDEEKNTILSSYMRLWHILKLPAVRICILFHLTSNIAFAADNSLSDLKFVEAGLPKEIKALLSIPLILVNLLVPVVVSRWTAGNRPMSLYMKAYFAGMAFAGMYAIMAFVTAQVKSEDGSFPAWYFPVLLLVDSLYNISATLRFVASVAFSAKISDPAYGATFMTMYNTAGALGGAWPTAISLWLVDPLTFRYFDGNGVSVKIFDGFYVETIGCIVLGTIWYFWGNRTMKKLQKKPEKVWRLSSLRENNEHT